MRAAKLGVDVLIAIAAFVLAFEIAAMPGKPIFFEDPRAPLVLAWGALYAGLTLLALIGFQMQRNTWRFVSVPDVGAIVRLAAITAVAFLVIVFISNRAYELPRTTFVLTGVFQILGMGLVRLMSRAIHERSLMAFFVPGIRPSRPRASLGLMVVGEPVRVDAFIRDAMQSKDNTYFPIAVLTPTPQWLGQRIRNVDVLGLSNELEEMVDRMPGGEPIRAVALLDEPAEIGLTAEKFSRISARGIKFLRANQATEVALGDDGDGLKEISLDDFLARPPIRLQEAPVREFVAGKRVLVTGAGGSIGSEICRQAAYCLHHYRPEGLAQTVYCDRAAIRPAEPLHDNQLAYGLAIRIPDNEGAPAKVAAVMVSPNSTQAMSAVVGGTKYIRLVTEAAAPRWIRM
jgi:O-antigen biosynthesis protein WbqV